MLQHSTLPLGVGIGLLYIHDSWILVSDGTFVYADIVEKGEAILSAAPVHHLS